MKKYFLWYISFAQTILREGIHKTLAPKSQRVEAKAENRRERGQQ